MSDTPQGASSENSQPSPPNTGTASAENHPDSVAGASQAQTAQEAASAAPPQQEDPSRVTDPPNRRHDDPPQNQNDVLDEEIFKRDLNEVHLLVDFVSGRADKNLNDLTVPDPSWQPVADKQRPMLDSSETVKRISVIRFPPDKIAKFRAEDASLLLLAKDRLSAMASPARGSTIAYTAMFVGLPGRILGQWYRPHPSRVMLASLAFPELMPHVKRFQAVFIGLIFFVFVWLFLTAVTYWDIALGSSILDRLGQLEHDKTIMLQANPALLACTAPQTTGQDASVKVSCLQLTKFANDQHRLEEDLSKYSRCRGVIRWLFIRCWSGSNFVGRNVAAERTSMTTAAGDQALPVAPANKPPPQTAGGGTTATPAQPAAPPVAPAPPAGKPESAQGGGDKPAQNAPAAAANASPVNGSASISPNQQTTGQTIASILGVFSTFVVPMMFGILGTLVAAIRAIHDKIRDSQLASRDLVLSLTGLPIGAIAGLAVGLFFSPSGGPVPASGGLTGGLSLTAGGLAFLAGYAADAFFSFLDSLRSQVFAATNPVPGAVPANPAAPPRQAGGAPAAAH